MNNKNNTYIYIYTYYYLNEYSFSCATKDGCGAKDCCAPNVLYLYYCVRLYFVYACRAYVPRQKYFPWVRFPSHSARRLGLEGGGGLSQQPAWWSRRSKCVLHMQSIFGRDVFVHTSFAPQILRGDHRKYCIQNDVLLALIVTLLLFGCTCLWATRRCNAVKYSYTERSTDDVHAYTLGKSEEPSECMER